MTGSKNDRSSKLRALFENELFLGELAKIKRLPYEEWDVAVIKLRNHWGLVWEYHDTLVHYIQTGEIDYSLGDKDIRVVDYRAQELQPSSDPKDEFRIMQTLSEDKKRGVYLKLPKELTQRELKDFVGNKETYALIEAALDNNYPGRIKNQSPELLTKTKVTIYLLHEQGLTDNEVADQMNCDPREVRRVVKEYKDKIKD